MLPKTAFVYGFKGMSVTLISGYSICWKQMCISRLSYVFSNKICLFFYFMDGYYLKKGITPSYDSLVAQRLRSLPEMQETQVGKIPWEEMCTHSSTLAWKTPWREDPGGATVHGVAKSRTWLSDTIAKLQSENNY